MTLAKLRDWHLQMAKTQWGNEARSEFHFEAADAIDRELSARGEAVAWVHPTYFEPDCDPNAKDECLSSIPSKGWLPLYKSAPPAPKLTVDDARVRILGRVLEAARRVVGWDWSDNDDDCVADINRLFDAVKAADALTAAVEDGRLE